MHPMAIVVVGIGIVRNQALLIDDASMSRCILEVVGIIDPAVNDRNSNSCPIVRKRCTRAVQTQHCQPAVVGHDVRRSYSHVVVGQYGLHVGVGCKRGKVTAFNGDSVRSEKPEVMVVPDCTSDNSGTSKVIDAWLVANDYVSSLVRGNCGQLLRYSCLSQQPRNEAKRLHCAHNKKSSPRQHDRLFGTLVTIL